MVRKEKVAKRAKRAEDLRETEMPPAYDNRSMLVRILDHIAEKGIYALILLVPLAFLPETYWLFDVTRVTVLRVLTIIVLTAYLSGVVISRQWRIVRPPPLVLWPILAYLVFYTISTIFSIAPNLSLFSGEGRNFGLISLINMILLYLLVINIMTDRKKLMRCLVMFIASSSIVALLGMYQFYGRIEDTHLSIMLGLSCVAALVFFYLAVFRGKDNYEQRVWFSVFFSITFIVVICLLFDLTKESGILYSQIEGTSSYTNQTRTYISCGPDLGSIGRYEGIHQLSSTMASRTSSTFGNPDFLISFLILPIPIALGYVLKRKWFYILPLLLLLLCLVLSIPYQELGNYWIIYFVIVFLIALFIAAVYIGRKFFVEHALIYVSVCLVILLVLTSSMFALNVYDAKDKGNAFLKDHVGLDPDDDRALLWGIALDTMDTSKVKVVGSGPNTFRDTFTQYVTLEYSQGKPDRREDKVHNAFIEALATTGWLGFISYSIMLISIVVYFMLWLLRNPGKRDFIFVSMILLAGLAYVLVSLTLFHTVIPYTFFWIVVAIGVGLTLVDNPRISTVNLNISKIFSLSLAAILLCIGFLGIFMAARPLVADHYFQEAQRASNCGNLAKAIPLYEKAHDWNDSEVHYHLDYAHALHTEAVYSGDPVITGRNASMIIEILDDAVQQEPESAMMYYNRAQLMYALGFHPDAVIADDYTIIGDVYKSIDLYPNGYLSYWFLAEMETIRGNLEQAIAADEYAFRIVPEYLGGLTPLSYYNESLSRLGRNYTALGALYEEDSDLEKAQELYEKAVDSLEQVIGSDPSDVGVRFFLGRAYERANYIEKAQAEYEEVIITLEEAVESQPDDDAIHYFLGAAYEATGELDKAEQEYRVALEINPNLQEAIKGLERLEGMQTEMDGS
jgi:tetratricopeptide (TPR) repeat protein